MSDTQPLLLVTGAGGQLGQLVVDHLLRTIPAAQIVAIVRNEAARRRASALGLRALYADYDNPGTLDAAFKGVGRALLISSNSIGRRVAQHQNLIEASKRANVGLVAYTSVLHADGSLLGLAGEHRETEALLRTSGVPFALLRNGWYTENYTAGIPAALAHNELKGSAGEGRIASASRQDYAEAAAAVLTTAENLSGRVFELAGDSAYTLRELAAEITRQSSKAIAYKDLPETEYRSELLNAGVADGIASLLSQSDFAASKGALYDEGRQLSRLIGRPTTSLAASVAAALE